MLAQGMKFYQGSSLSLLTELCWRGWLFMMMCLLKTGWFCSRYLTWGSVRDA
jgi:hypothetical protein